MNQPGMWHEFIVDDVALSGHGYQNTTTTHGNIENWAPHHNGNIENGAPLPSPLIVSNQLSPS